MKKFLADFKEFATKGNVVDMAVGLVIGTAFKDIVNGLVNHIITPLIGLATGGGDFKDLKLVLREAVTEAGQEVVPALTLNYGAFLQTIIDFLIIALSIFLVIRVMTGAKKRLAALNKKKLEEEAKLAAEQAAKAAEEEARKAEEAKKQDPAYILGEIRDLLKERKQ